MAKTTVKVRCTLMPSASTMVRFSTPARMTRPRRVNRSSASSPAKSSACDGDVDRKRSFGRPGAGDLRRRRQPRRLVQRVGSEPQMPWTAATAASERPTVTSTCWMWWRYSGRMSDDLDDQPDERTDHDRHGSDDGQPASGHRPTRGEGAHGEPAGIRAAIMNAPCAKLSTPMSP